MPSNNDEKYDGYNLKGIFQRAAEIVGFIGGFLIARKIQFPIVDPTNLTYVGVGFLANEFLMKDLGNSLDNTTFGIKVNEVLENTYKKIKNFLNPPSI